MLKLTRIDSWRCHIALEENDKCFHWREYTVGKDYSYSDTNRLIKNLKIKPSQTKRLPYKMQAIQQLTKEFIERISPILHTHDVIVPVPSSKVKGDNEYHNSIDAILCKVKKDYPNLDYRELVLQNANTLADHEVMKNQRQTIEQLLKNYSFNVPLKETIPKRIIIFDDVITSGRHFKAMKCLLSQYYPEVPIYGVFIARAVNPHAE